MCGKYFSEMITAEKWFPFSSANFPLLFLLFYFGKFREENERNKNHASEFLKFIFPFFIFENWIFDF